MKCICENECNRLCVIQIKCRTPQHSLLSDSDNYLKVGANRFGGTTLRPDFVVIEEGRIGL